MFFRKGTTDIKNKICNRGNQNKTTQLQFNTFNNNYNL